MSFCIQDRKTLFIKPFPKTVKQTPPKCKKTLLCVKTEASYTLEAAVVLPLLAGFFVSILFFFRVLQVQTQVQEALFYAGRKTACEASTTDSQVALRATAEVLFRKEISRYDTVKQFVSGGTAGISLIKSEFKNKEIILNVDYKVRLPVNFFTVKGIQVSQSSRSRKWIGDADKGKEVDYVYVTEHGSVYHYRRTCPYLDLSIQAVNRKSLSSLRNKSGHKYYGCTDCVVENSKCSVVYITDYGTCYHTSLSCSGLKRTVHLVPLSETGGKGPCSKCGAGP